MRRKLSALVLICIMLSVFISGCSSKTGEPKEYIGILSAMDNEIAILLEEAVIDRVDTIADVEYHIGSLHGVPVIISKIGIGKIRAASSVTTMLIKYPISKVIFTGIAGGVADETQVLDEVIATRLVEHDYGRLSNEGFEWKSGDPGIGNEEGLYYDCDPQLVQYAYDAAVEVIGEEHSFKGTIATGDQFIANSEYVEKLRRDYDAYACEMEGAAVAVVCIRNKTPFVVLRALSDKADGKEYESYENFGDIAADNSSRIVIKMLDYMGQSMN
ncbi:MAG: 5'-methylthioadenosine/adenosylhomocysteine nucleosidase [Lachnospiraceae bacterium]|nr:5'-methylthioadenosine/adenosylhomocysteine nucleosidase [Lachnospiraceae bacterium]